MPSAIEKDTFSDRTLLCLSVANIYSLEMISVIMKIRNSFHQGKIGHLSFLQTCFAINFSKILFDHMLISPEVVTQSKQAGVHYKLS